MKGTSITQKVRDAVYLRDSDMDGIPRCVICRRANPQIHHYIERSRGGLGTERNLICLCYRCHTKYHNTLDKGMKELMREHLMECYPDWDESQLTGGKNEWL